MTVICPSCDARFRDPPIDLPKTNPLQCSKCEHEWVPAQLASPRLQLDTPSMAPEMADLVGDKNEIRTTLPVTISKPHESPKREPVYVDRFPASPQKRAGIRAWHGAAFACLALFAGSIIFKQTVMATLPQTQPFYLAAGLTTANPGLQIDKVTTTKSSKDGIRQLIVRGEIQNIATATVPVPPIKLIMRGESQSNLYAWTVTATRDTLKSGEKSRFTAVAQGFPDKAVDVEVEFAPIKIKDGSLKN